MFDRNRAPARILVLGSALSLIALVTEVTPAGATVPATVVCGQTITHDTTLSGDVGPCAGDGVTVGADGITFNLNGHTIRGTAHSLAGFAGIRLQGRTKVTVTNGTVTGFDAGVSLMSSRQNTLVGLTVHDNIGPDDPDNAFFGDGIILMDSGNNVIKSNIVAHNGIFDGIGLLGEGSHDNDIVGNTITDTLGPSNLNPYGAGIYINPFTNIPPTGLNLLKGNNIVGNTVLRSAGTGIGTIDVSYTKIVGNTLDQDGLRNLFQGGIQAQLSLFSNSSDSHLVIAGNRVQRTGAVGIFTQGNYNQITGNASDYNGFTGYQVAANSTDLDNVVQGNSGTGNQQDGLDVNGMYSRVIGNYMVGNGLANIGNPSNGATDLFDDNYPTCGTNDWFGNTYTLADPPCTTDGGTFVPAPPTAAPTSVNATARRPEIIVPPLPAPRRISD